MELKPSLGDLLKPLKVTKTEFDSKMQRMQGFQRVVSKFQTSNLSTLPPSLLKAVALTSVGKLTWKENKLRLAGMLPANTDPVFVLFQCDEAGGSGNVTVCCESAVAVNSIMNALKRAIAN